jgi:hypothetical protein
MEVFSALNIDTYKQATREFLSNFSDNLITHQQNCTVTFTLNGTPHSLTFQQFCDFFGFSYDGEVNMTDGFLVEEMVS